MADMAMHLRNCPKCMEKYTKYKKRKIILEKFCKSLMKKISMEEEISSYIDYEAGYYEAERIKNEVLINPKYFNLLKKLIENKMLFLKCKHYIEDNKNTPFADKIIRQIKSKRINNFFKKITRPFRLIRHVFAKYG